MMKILEGLPWVTKQKFIKKLSFYLLSVIFYRKYCFPVSIFPYSFFTLPLRQGLMLDSPGYATVRDDAEGCRDVKENWTKT